VGWCRRPRNRTKKALNNSLLVLGLWRHNIWAPHLIGFARCTGDGVLTATIWDLVIHPLYQHNGLGKGLLDILTTRLRQMQVENVNLFADAKAVDFYSGQGWELEPQGKRCMAM
jgi:ribosomal protein S18 acetylase RimI-like enzyme